MCVCGVGGKNPEQIREKKRPIFCAFFSKEQNITQFQCLYVNQALLIVILQKVLLKAALLLKEAKGWSSPLIYSSVTLVNGFPSYAGQKLFDRHAAISLSWVRVTGLPYLDISKCFQVISLNEIVKYGLSDVGWTHGCAKGKGFLFRL